MRAANAFSFFLAAGAAGAQDAPNLAAYLKGHPEARGLAVSAEERPPLPNGAGLARYGRKAVRIGTVTAIVPLRAVAFDETLAKTPNLYDGMPRDAKVLYLLSALDAAQWRKAGGAGIGLGDLRGEQRDVFASLLPKRLAWTKERAGEDRLRGNVVGRGEADERDRAATRLRVQREIEFHVPLEGQEHSYTFRSPDMEGGEPGHETLRRDTADEQEPTEAFGVTLRADVPNVLKKGQLDTASLDASVTLPARTTVGAALASVGAASGRTILADARVRERTVAWAGGAARAGDLLDALALAVEGTYRRVDGTYLLVADVVGAGTRKLRLTLWQEELDAEVHRRTRKWLEGIAASGLASAARFPEDDPLSPKDGLASRLGVSPWDEGYGKYFPTSELSAAQRAFLDRQAERYKNQPVQRDRIAVASQLRYAFVLPGGAALAPEGYLGQDYEFRPRTAPKSYGEPPVNPGAAIPTGARRPLALRAETAEEARRAVETARRYGFTELWIETERAEALAAAVAGGLPTRLFARPWALRAARPDSDRTVLGETGRGVMARQEGSPLWEPLIRMVRLQSWPRMGPVLVDGDAMSPFDPQWPARRSALAALARTPGLAGVVLSEAAPHGYEAGDDRSTVGSYARWLGESWELGYDERARLAFFRAHGVDPVDVSPPIYRRIADVQAPFFPREGAGGAPSLDELDARWREFRARANARALAELRAATPGVPYLIDVRRASVTQVPLNVRVIAPWEKAGEPPSYEGQYAFDFPNGVPTIVVPEPRRALGVDDSGNAYRGMVPKAEAPVALDLTRVPSARWEDLLGKWLAPLPEKPRPH